MAGEDKVHFLRLPHHTCRVLTTAKIEAVGVMCC